jgi:hypothetical protein
MPISGRYRYPTSLCVPVRSLSALANTVSSHSFYSQWLHTVCLIILTRLLLSTPDVPSLFRIKNVLDFFTPRFLGARVGTSTICYLNVCSLMNRSGCLTQNSL